MNIHSSANPIDNCRIWISVRTTCTVVGFICHYLPTVFTQSREDVRLTYCTVYLKMQEPTAILDPLETQIAAVISDHPEYHALLGDQETALTSDFTPEGGQTNPFLHMGMHLAIREQISTDRPPGIRIQYHKLARRLGEAGAEHQIMECLGRSLWQAQQNNNLPDERDYLRCIENLV